jgi:hypothetical protein
MFAEPLSVFKDLWMDWLDVPSVEAFIVCPFMLALAEVWLELSSALLACVLLPAFSSDCPGDDGLGRLSSFGCSGEFFEAGELFKFPLPFWPNIFPPEAIKKTGKAVAAPAK